MLEVRDGKNGIELGGMLPMCALDELLYGESCSQGEDLIMELAEWTRERSPLANAFGRVRLPVAWARAAHFKFSRQILRWLCGYFEHQRRVQFEGCVAEPLYTLTAVLPAPKWSGLLLRIVLQDALSEVMKVYPPMKPKACVDDISAFMDVRNEEFRGLVEKVSMAMRREVC